MYRCAANPRSGRSRDTSVEQARGGPHRITPISHPTIAAIAHAAETPSHGT